MTYESSKCSMTQSFPGYCEANFRWLVNETGVGALEEI